MINVEFSKQQVNKTWSLQIESSMSNLNGSMSVSSTNETTVDPDATFSAEIPQESNALNLGSILGPCLLFLIILLYFWGKRVEHQEEEERTREASRLEENRRKFLKDHVNIKVSPYVFESTNLPGMFLIASNRYTEFFCQRHVLMMKKHSRIETQTKDRNQMKKIIVRNHPVLITRQMKTFNWMIVSRAQSIFWRMRLSALYAMKHSRKEKL